MRYFDLFDDMSVKRRWHLADVTAGGQEVNWPLTDGRPYQGATPVDVELQHRGPPLDFTTTAFGVPVVSRDLAAAVERLAGSDVQRVPARIRGHPGFEVLNVVRAVDCLDEGRSIFMKWTEQDGRPDKVGNFRMVTKLRLDPKRIHGDAHLFRLARWTVALVVSEQLKEAMERAECRGARFTLVSEDETKPAGEARPVDRVYEALFQAVAKETGPLDPDTLTGVVGFSAGGPLSFRTAKAGDHFVTYLSCELVEDPEQKVNGGGPYELMITCDDEDWVLEQVSTVARQGHDFALGGGHTLDLGPMAGRRARIQGVAFEEVARVQVACKPYRVLRCHGLLRPELEYARKKSVEALLGKLKSAGVYPRTSPKRSRSVV